MAKGSYDSRALSLKTIGVLVRRFVVVAGVVSLVLGLLVGSAAGQQLPDFCEGIDPSPFADISTSVHREAIDCLYAHEVTSGVTPTTYAPRHSVTRAQMATFILNALRFGDAVVIPEEAPHRFTDVPTDSSHAESINILAELEIIQGRTTTTFAPNALVTRGQMATFMGQAYSASTGETMEPTDQGFEDTAGNLHEDAINIIAELGITVGATPTEYRPLDNVRRDQMASFLVRLLGQIDNGVPEEPVEPPDPQEPDPPEDPEEPQPPAPGEPLECGDVVTQSVTLDQDLVCEEGFPEPALRIGADNVSINLDGNSVIIPGGVAVLNDGFSGVTIDRGSLIGDWDTVGVEINGAEDVSIRQVMSAPILVRGSQDVTIEDNALGNDGDWPYTVDIRESRDVSVSENTISSSAEWAVGVVDSQDITVENNMIPAYAGVNILDGQDGRVEGNTIVVGRRRGIVVRSGANHLLRDNVVTGSDFDGIVIHNAATNTMLDGNVSSENDLNGFTIGSPTTTVQNNTADNNGDWGIWAVDGVHDGGGNRAQDNGEGQCLNVVCE